MLAVVFPQRCHVFPQRFSLRILDISSCDTKREGRCSGDYFCILCVKYIFLAEALDSKVLLRTLKRFYVSHIMRSRCRSHFRYVTNNILLSLQVYLTRSIGH